MKSTIATVLVSGMAAMVHAKASFTNGKFNIEAGQAFNLTWRDDNGSGPFVVELRNGPSNNLQPVLQVGSTSNNYFVWTPPATLPTDKYAFVITDSTGEPNYSVQWDFQGKAAAVQSSVSSSITTTASTTASMTASTTASTTASATASTTTYTSATTTTVISASPTSTSLPSPSSTKSNFTLSTTNNPTLAALAPTTTASIIEINAGQRIEKSLAFLLVAVAGFIFLN